MTSLICINTYIGCAVGAMDTGSKCEIRETSSNSNMSSHLLCANTLRNIMHPPIYVLNRKASWSIHTLLAVRLMNGWQLMNGIV